MKRVINDDSEQADGELYDNEIYICMNGYDWTAKHIYMSICLYMNILYSMYDSDMITLSTSTAMLNNIMIHSL